jgi:hypothetical protein
MSKRVKTFARVTACLGLVAIGVYAVVRVMSPYPAVPATTAFCMVRNEAHLPDVSGLHFQRTRMSCDTFGNDVSVSLIVSKTPRDTGDVIFKYDPNERRPIPTVALTGNHFQKAVPSVSSVYFKAQKCRGLTIDYEIGSVVVPDEGFNSTKMTGPRFERFALDLPCSLGSIL